ncbi:hypothetical protein GSS88_04290 [Corynebacterium sp. 3HC-13]|uniref:LppP/LprE family lipoprotein n=1 Tax=Corynebacterium poyangense TaxID=2684405 RepID=UPI00165D01F4|nr:LppP/LprE family lipoprotein [Corynebacterium poyangense]MBZ8177018.1 hypothetical protein [Corynebacterium poyangense]
MGSLSTTAKALLGINGLLLVVVSVGTGVVLGSKSAQQNKAQETPTTTMHSTERDVESISTTSEETSSDTPTSTSAELHCGTDLDAEEVHRAANEASKKYAIEFGWIYSGQGNYDPCRDVSYVLLEQNYKGNSQFLTLTLLFHKREYVGVDSDRPQQVQKATADQDTLTITYRDWESGMADGVPNAGMAAYTSTVTYYWDGNKIAHHGTIPNAGLSRVGS